MSKSKGNVIDPLDLIDGIGIEELVQKRTQSLMNPKQVESVEKQTRRDYPDGFGATGADALRFTFTALATHGREVRFDVKRLDGSRNFCNKLWNATRFVLMNAMSHKDLIGKSAPLSLIDTWILGQLQQLIIDVDYAYSTYRFDIAAQKLYEFMWNDYCDWYVELAKVNLQNQDLNIRTATMNTLLQALECCLRLLHPIMPFITEELWQSVSEVYGRKYAPSIMTANYPTKDEIIVNDVSIANSEMQGLKDIIIQVRNLRGEMSLNPALKVPLIVEGDANSQFNGWTGYIQSLAKVSELHFVTNLANQIAPIAVVNAVRIMLEVEVDKNAEKIRLNKEIEKNIKELEKVKLKLDNPEFINRAPADLIARDNKRLQELEKLSTQLKKQLAKLA
jgi:valyl-tRNA synthetase